MTRPHSEICPSALHLLHAVLTYRLRLLDAVSVGDLSLYTPFLNVLLDRLGDVEFVRVRVRVLGLSELVDVLVSELVESLQCQGALQITREILTDGSSSASASAAETCFSALAAVAGALAAFLAFSSAFWRSFCLRLSSLFVSFAILISEQVGIRLGNHLSGNLILVQVGSFGRCRHCEVSFENGQR